MYLESGGALVFTTAKRALSFQQKRAFIHEILFSFFKWGTLTQTVKGHFFTFKESDGGGHMPPLPPGSAAPGCLWVNVMFVVLL
jgi:hypothetical protein